MKKHWYLEIVVIISLVNLRNKVGSRIQNQDFSSVSIGISRSYSPIGLDVNTIRIKQIVFIN